MIAPLTTEKFGENIGKTRTGIEYGAQARRRIERYNIRDRNRSLMRDVSMCNMGFSSGWNIWIGSCTSGLDDNM